MVPRVRECDPVLNTTLSLGGHCTERGFVLSGRRGWVSGTQFRLQVRKVLTAPHTHTVLRGSCLVSRSYFRPLPSCEWLKTCPVPRYSPNPLFPPQGPMTATRDTNPNQTETSYTRRLPLRYHHKNYPSVSRGETCSITLFYCSRPPMGAYSRFCYSSVVLVKDRHR